MVLEFIFQSGFFWFLSALYWGSAIVGWAEIALSTGMSWSAFRWSAMVIAGLYFGALGIVALAIWSFN